MLGCVENCGHFGPPPDTILSMPPPPLPSFLIPNTAVIALPPNDTHPCFAAFLCEPNPRPRESGLEFIELTGRNHMENTWVFVLISSCVGVLILGALFAIILLKCRETLFSSCNLSYHDSNIKQTTMSALGEPSKANPFMAGGILYPCATNRDSLQHQLTNDNRLLWATLTPHGTRHFVSDYPLGHDGHYEVVDYRAKDPVPARDYVKRTPIKSFDNSGFIDYDYEDPTPLMDSYHDDLDSGYQEPQEVLGTLSRSSPRPLVSSPTKIENPNIPPLNIYPHRSNTSHSGTLNRKATLSRRISDASSYGGPNM
ncbi:uncharacterized protein LOC129947112 [Eupeodes corollae]|uniref:uncharacterized protein LOC129947112 n=1 Tax=Eupeodes corollae TaxID=290404 RepID=UPI0024906F30|nr:uncharacterized protein LOC129947112 [Eupeodes corollae]XP_055913522.1 uncharacterized protein LOC129947112 [Eupeodes corollae]